MAINIITGKPRHGKTYFMATKIAKMLKKGERVFSNIKINIGVGALKKLSPEIEGDYNKKEDRENPEKLLFYWTHIHQWEHFEKGNIIVDEAQRYFNARQWSLLSEDTEIKLQQHGKEDLTVWGTTQHHSRIDITLKLLVENFYVVKTVIGKATNKKPFLGIKLFRIIAMDLEDIDDYYYSIKHPDQKIELEGVTSKPLLFRKKYAIIYDTYQKVGKSESMPLVHKERKCEVCGEIMVTHK